jgi:hypothetical protein
MATIDNTVTIPIAPLRPFYIRARLDPWKQDKLNQILDTSLFGARWKSIIEFGPFLMSELVSLYHFQPIM